MLAAVFFPEITGNRSGKASVDAAASHALQIAEAACSC